MSNAKCVAPNGALKPFKFSLPVQDYRSLPIPAMDKAKIGDCFVRVTDLPDGLSDYMSVNPRVPNRNKKQLLTGSVVKGIKQTLLYDPTSMAIKNQGIYILVDSMAARKDKGGKEFVDIQLSDTDRHGIVNGGHTFASIMEVLETSSEDELEQVKEAYVRLHLLHALPDEAVPEIAEGLNRNKQVDDPSLANLKGYFKDIEAVMKEKPGSDEIAYHQGDDGEMYIREVLVLLQIFNPKRFPRGVEPQALYNGPGKGLNYFEEDLEKDPALVNALTAELPTLLKLHDTMKQAIPAATKEAGFTFGLMKDGRHRTGSKVHKNINLPFLNTTMDHRVPKGWLYPMLSSLRLALSFNEDAKKLVWSTDPFKLIESVAHELAKVCVEKHAEKVTPDRVGKQASAYRACDAVVGEALTRLEIEKLKKQLSKQKAA